MDNIHDMARKGRSPRGEKHGSSKLTTAQVSKIKAMLAENKLFMSEIALEFGVAQTTIRAIKRGKTWRHVQPPDKNAAPTEQKISPLRQ